MIFGNSVASRSLGQVYGVGSEVQTGETLRLVGFGCDNIETRDGSGVKRTGTNVVANIDDFVEFVTPEDATTGSASQESQKILGPDNRAGSCFGDSGGPAL